jgi:hypothetical protein
MKSSPFTGFTDGAAAMIGRGNQTEMICGLLLTQNGLNAILMGNSKQIKLMNS